ncbi:MAG TPA: glycosyltransferase [Solimonas sp.]|nr:glycosyltransferase [Solimonas sp.]
MTIVESRPASAADAPIRSLQVIASPGLGGAEIAYQRTVEALTRAGHATTCILRRNARLGEVLANRMPLRSEPLRSYWDLGSVLRIRALLKTGQWPIVQTWATRATWLTRAPRGVLHIARIGGFYRLSRFRHADGWIVNTPSLRAWLLDEGFPAERVIHIDNFVPDLPAGAAQTLTRASLGIGDDALLLVGSGRLTEAKGFHDLLAALAALPAAYDGRPLHLLLLGDGPYRPHLEQLAAQLGIAARVHFAGWIEHAVATLPIGDLFVLPSHKEALGNVILEAWSRGLPAVSTATAGGQYLIRDGANGLLAPIADASALANVLDRVLGDPALRTKLAREGHEYFRSRFSERSTVAAYEDFYRRIITLGPQRRR